MSLADQMSIRLADIESLLLVGCGKMGSALLKGWLDHGLKARQVLVIEPYPSDWLSSLQDQGLKLNQAPITAPDIVVVATKPQMMAEALPSLQSYGNGSTHFISIAAGTLIATFEEMLGVQTPITRAMPNTPAAIGHGVSVLVSNDRVGELQKAQARSLMQAVGMAVELEDEAQMHAVTALSGSGPAYVFAFAESMIAAGIDAGLGADVAAGLALGTIAGAGQLMVQSDEEPAFLREQVTSPNGTTAAGLAELTKPEQGLRELVQKTIQAAKDRSIQLSKD